MRVGQGIHGYLREQGFDRFDTVFEIGCGAGGILRFFQSVGSRTFGCDFWEEGVRFGCDAGLALAVGGPQSLTRFGRADLLILCHTLEHFPRPLETLLELHQLLEPRGIVYVEAPGVHSIRQTHGDVLEWLQNAHVWYFSLETLDFTMNLAGFTRVVGDELARGIYRSDRGVTPRVPDPRVANRVLRSLLRTERLRYWPRMRDVKSMVRKGLGDQAYEWLRRRVRQWGLRQSIVRRW
jgi:SAM-dependent methyltransferase